MKKAYHTTKSKRYPMNDGIYHNSEHCPSGGRIGPIHRKPGKGKQRRLCDLCILAEQIRSLQGAIEEIGTRLPPAGVTPTDHPA